VNTFLEKSYKETAKELRSIKTKEELKNVSSQAHKQLDEVFATELFRSEMSIACCAGCHYCCHVKVDIQPREIFLIADFIRSRFSIAKQADVLNKAQENWKKIEPMTSEQHFNAGLPCPLLDEGKCSVYPVRPSSCRKAHSLRAEPCKKFLENPESNENFAETVSSVKIATSCTYVGTSTAFEPAGYDSQPYDLNAALTQALQNPSSERRWRDGKLAFPSNMLAKDWPKGMKGAKLFSRMAGG
jgi:Fe-S-cluster containining protein